MDELEAEIRNKRARAPFGPDGLCRNCVWWSLETWRKEKDLAGDDGLWSDVRGECRRHAPAPLQQIIIKTGQLVGLTAWAAEDMADIEHDKTQDYALECIDMNEVDGWPRTFANDWCGEFKAGRRAMSAADIAMFEEMQRINDIERDNNG